MPEREYKKTTTPALHIADIEEVAEKAKDVYINCHGR